MALSYGEGMVKFNAIQMLHFNCILCQIVTRYHQKCYNLLRNISLLCGEIKFQLRFSDSVYRGIFGCYNPIKYFDMQIIRNAGREKIPGQRRRTVRDRGVEPAGTSGLRHRKGWQKWRKL